MRKKSFQIALASVSCAIATVVMAVCINLSFAFASGWLLASIALMIPLSKDMRLGAVLAYVATVLLCLPFGGIAQFYKLFPFLAFFGLHPFINYMQRQFHIRYWIAFIVKVVWFVLVMEFTWVLFDSVVQINLPFQWMNDWIYVLIGVSSAILFLIYDRLMMRCQQLVNYYVSKIDRTNRKSNDSAQGVHLQENKQDDVFEEMRSDADSKDKDSSEKEKTEDKKKDQDIHDGQ